MNLIDRDELQKDVQVWHQQLEEGCVQELDPTEATDRFEEMLLSQIVIDPATLDIAALKAWGEMKGYLERGKDFYDGEDQMSNPEKSSIYELLLRHMVDLESGLSERLAEARKVMVNADILDQIYKKCSEDHEAEVHSNAYYVQKIDKLLAQARADLAKGEVKK